MLGSDELLKNHILPLSLSQDYTTAKKEWILIDIEYSEELDSCPCGQKIKEKCYIQNNITQNITYVGNKCINKFLGIETGKSFNSLKQIIKNIDKKPNEDLIKWAYKLGYIDDRDKKFLSDIKNSKKKLSDPQIKWLEDINCRIIKRQKKYRFK